MKLTDSFVAGLELPTGKTEHFEWDDSLPGFGVRLRGGTKRWYCQYRVGQQQRRESLGDVRKIRIEAARAIARKRFAAVELGTDPAADRAKAKAEAVEALNTLGVVADRYLSAKKDVLRPSSYAAARRYMAEHWQILRAMPITAIKRADIAAVLQEITAERGRISAARARANLGARHFSRRFKSAFGSTPAVYVEQLRLEEARKRLGLKRHNIKTVAASLGYASADAFGRAFERRFGVRPSVYERQFAPR